MAMQDKQAFIEDLAGSHRRRRPLLPAPLRALLWFVLAFAVSAGLMHHVQVFRPGFAGQLVHHPFFLLEVLGALLLAAAGAYLAMARAVPGEPISGKILAAFWLLAAVFLLGFGAGFTHFAPETSPVGARHACWLEVLVYGGVCLLAFTILIRRGFVRFSWKTGMLYGLMAGLVPAALMQLACMYDPMHALIFHYLPAVILIPVGLAVMRLIQK